MGEVRKVRERGANPTISVVIPSLDGVRDGNVARLVGDLEGQTEQSFEIILAIGFKPNGHARNQGVKAAAGTFLVCIDDDVRLGHERVLEQLIQPFAEVPGIGMTGPAQLIPPDSSSFQRRAARQISRASCPVVKALTDSDFVSHMCLCIPTQLYKDVGWESDTLPRGTDPDLRRRVRQAGYRIVVVPDCWAYHPAPESWGRLLKMSWRNGAGGAWVHKHHPEMCIDTPDGHAREAKCHGRPYRAARFFARTVKRMAMLQYIGLSADVAYGAGYLYAVVSGRDGLR